MGAMVTTSDACTFGVQEDVESMQSGETAGVGETGGVEEGSKESFKARRAGSGLARVDMGVNREGSL